MRVAQVARIRRAVLLGVLAGPAVAAHAAPALKADPRGTCGQLEWPREALRYEIEGVARLRFRLAPDGTVTEAGIDKSTGWALLDEASVHALRNCKFTPRQAVDADGRVLKVEHVWTLEGVRVHPLPVPDSCPASDRFTGFLPFDLVYTNAEGIRVRFMVGASGQPYGIKAEGADLPAEQVAQAINYVERCRFAFDPEAAGVRTDTVSGRVMFKFQ